MLYHGQEGVHDAEHRSQHTRRLLTREWGVWLQGVCGDFQRALHNALHNNALHTTITRYGNRDLKPVSRAWAAALHTMHGSCGATVCSGEQPCTPCRSGSQWRAMQWQCCPSAGTYNTFHSMQNGTRARISR
eukprot:1159306-Pelagomonas_calceolata.AAC.19